MTSPPSIGGTRGRRTRSSQASRPVKLRTKVTKGAGSKKAALAAYKLLDAAQERWQRFNGHELVTDVLDNVKFKDGIKVTDDETTTTDEKVAA
jgi:putative transposase